MNSQEPTGPQNQSNGEVQPRTPTQMLQVSHKAKHHKHRSKPQLSKRLSVTLNLGAAAVLVGVMVFMSTRPNQAPATLPKMPPEQALASQAVAKPANPLIAGKSAVAEDSITKALAGLSPEIAAELTTPTSVQARVAVAKTEKPNAEAINPMFIPELEELRGKASQAFKQFVNQPFQEAQRVLVNKYLDLLEKVADQREKAGNIADSVALRREMAAVRQGSLPPASGDLDPPPLSKLRKLWRDSLDTPTMAQYGALVSLQNECYAELKRIEKKLTEDKKAELAAHVRLIAANVEAFVQACSQMTDGKQSAVVKLGL